MTENELIRFIREWLAAWTGNRPGLLLEFYADDLYYQDPAMPGGIKDKESLGQYFTKLLAKNSEWRWEMAEYFITAKGLVLKWKAEIPVNGQTIELYGLDILEMQNGKISRNEVYFDRHDWLMAARKQ